MLDKKLMVSTVDVIKILLYIYNEKLAQLFLMAGSKVEALQLFFMSDVRLALMVSFFMFNFPFC